MRLHRSSQTILWSFILAGLWACAVFDLSGEIDNLFDPADPDYQPPQTEILSGPAEGSVLDTSTVTFQWRHANSLYWPDSAGTDVTAQIQYAYRLNGALWAPWVSGEDLLISSTTTPGWSYDLGTGIHELNLDFLEDDNYTFEVRSQYPTNITESDWPVRKFRIDALEGTALLISPSHAYVDSGASFFLAAKVVDITDLMGVHLKLAYDPEYLRIRSFDIQSDSTDFLLQNTGQYIEFLEHDTTRGLFDLNIAIAGGNVTGISGTGTLVRFIFSHVGPTGETLVNILPESTLRNVRNETTVDLILPGVVSIW